ncbi:uncharacterized protein LOC117121073 [Anneissia japonica]|uniref:uncharacterized protein LOC117121073 n=1 Tax=Anneissia japonica TaxID=1529436 RepID=UPI0014256426|nr:uncharacterized protein LOC117121073 [Anneissia japonica]
MSWNQPNGIPPLVGQAKGKFGKRFRKYEYVLDPDVTFCNNGAFSAVPKRVLEVQARFRYIQETDPEAWFRYEVKREIANATDKVAEMFGSNPENLILVENASTGKINYKNSKYLSITQYKNS